MEGYPGLVVHGPLTAVLLMDLVRRHAGRPVRTFGFRARAPLFDLAPFRVSGVPGGGGARVNADQCRAVSAASASCRVIIRVIGSSGEGRKSQRS